MQRKGSNVRDAVEAPEVSAALERTRSLTTEEDKVVRMRYGAKASPGQRLERHGEGNQELQDELLLMEMQLLRAWRQHQKAQAQRAAAPASRAKDKIVRALRKKH